MDRLRLVIDEFVGVVKEAINGEPKSPVEILLDQHLPLDEDLVTFSPKNCTAVAIPTATMNDFAARTKNILDYPFIMERVWEILVDHQPNPPLMRKALNLLLYLLVNGAIQVLRDCQVDVRLCYLQNLSENYNRYEMEQYQFSQHLDVGAGVRKTAAKIVDYLTNEHGLFQARSEAEVIHQKLANRGLRSASSSSLGSTPVTFPTSSLRPPQYTDYHSSHDDIGLKIVTHPNEMFDDLPSSPRSAFSSPTNGRHAETTTDAVDDATRSLERGHSRKQSTERKQRPPMPPTPVDKTVDLLGLETLGLESLIAKPRLPESPTTIPRTQSQRLVPPSQRTATI